MVKLSTIDDLTRAAAEDPSYDYAGRAGYYMEAASMLPDCRTILEIGPGRCPLASGEGVDYLDIREIPGISLRWCFDARETPWPIPDRGYDAVVALQCLEHFTGAQSAVWREIRRAAGCAVISLPYLWTDADAVHNGIGLDRILEWTGEFASAYSMHTDRLGYRRIVLLYPDLLEKPVDQPYSNTTNKGVLPCP